MAVPNFIKNSGVASGITMEIVRLRNSKRNI